uniref:F-box domain-containing protein n=1 Tax=Bionectria ochroleuca TaxID=29856 RepID=A0A8H7N0M4_BIOOC
MLSDDPNSNVKLSADILYFVFSHTDQPTLRNCRLLSHSACSVATPSLFRRLRLSAAEGEAERFLHVAQNESLRCHVQKIIIDTNVGGGFEYRHNASYVISRHLS